jgi:hypothetical protein
MQHGFSSNRRTTPARDFGDPIAPIELRTDTEPIPRVVLGATNNSGLSLLSGVSAVYQHFNLRSMYILRNSYQGFVT